ARHHFTLQLSYARSLFAAGLAPHRVSIPTSQHVPLCQPRRYRCLCSRAGRRRRNCAKDSGFSPASKAIRPEATAQSTPQALPLRTRTAHLDRAKTQLVAFVSDFFGPLIFDLRIYFSSFAPNTLLPSLSSASTSTQPGRFFPGANTNVFPKAGSCPS